MNARTLIAMVREFALVNLSGGDIEVWTCGPIQTSQQSLIAELRQRKAEVLAELHAQSRRPATAGVSPHLRNVEFRG
jgi:hypothetical protein